MWQVRHLLRTLFILDTVPNSDAIWPPAQQTFHWLTLVALLSVITHNAPFYSQNATPQCTILLPECNIHLLAAFSSHFRRENVVHSIVALHYSLFSATIMVGRSVQVFKEYEERLRNADNVPRFSYGWCVMTVIRTDIFWCTCSVNNQWRFSSYRTSDCLRHVLQGNHAGLFGGLLCKDWWS